MSERATDVGPNAEGSQNRRTSTSCTGWMKIAQKNVPPQLALNWKHLASKPVSVRILLGLNLQQTSMSDTSFQTSSAASLFYQQQNTRRRPFALSTSLQASWKASQLSGHHRMPVQVQVPVPLCDPLISHVAELWKHLPGL